MGEATLLAAGEGEPLNDNVQAKADLEQLALTESLYPPGLRGPDRHVHREHADCFWVLEGELEFGVADQTITLGAGGFAHIPPNVVHTFGNESGEESRFLNIHAPSKNFIAHLRDDEPFDTFDPPDDGGLPASEAIVRRPGEGAAIALGPSSAVFKAEGHDGIGSLSLTETTLAPGFPGPVAHVHERLADSFYVLDGTLTVRLGDEEVEAGPRSYALAPPGTVHTFANRGDEPVRMLNLMAPGGFEQYLKEVAAASRPGEPPDPERMAEIAVRYDFRPAD